MPIELKSAARDAAERSNRELNAALALSRVIVDCPESLSSVLDGKTAVQREEILNAVEWQLACQRQTRIAAQLDAIIAENPGIDREDWLARAMADESILPLLAETLLGAPR